MRLSEHFVENWKLRVGTVPTEPLVTRILEDSVMVQKCFDVPQGNGVRRRMLAIYWHPVLDLILKIDEIRQVAVTVLSKQNHEARRFRKNKKEVHRPDPRRQVEARAQ
jgi:hypothetical protein